MLGELCENEQVAKTPGTEVGISKETEWSVIA